MIEKTVINPVLLRLYDALREQGVHSALFAQQSDEDEKVLLANAVSVPGEGIFIHTDLFESAEKHGKTVVSDALFFIPNAQLQKVKKAQVLMSKNDLETITFADESLMLTNLVFDDGETVISRTMDNKVTVDSRPSQTDTLETVYHLANTRGVFHGEISLKTEVDHQFLTGIYYGEVLPIQREDITDFISHSTFMRHQKYEYTESVFASYIAQHLPEKAQAAFADVYLYDEAPDLEAARSGMSP